MTTKDYARLISLKSDVFKCNTFAAVSGQFISHGACALKNWKVDQHSPPLATLSSAASHGCIQQALSNLELPWLDVQASVSWRAGWLQPLVRVSRCMYHVSLYTKEKKRAAIKCWEFHLIARIF